MPATAENPLPKVQRKIIVGKERIPKPAQKRMEAARERQQQALELRKARATYNDIAKALGFANAGNARRAVQAAMRRTEFDLAKDVLLMDLVSLDELQMRCTEQLRKGDLYQVDRILKIMEQRYKIAGVSARTVEEVRDLLGIEKEETNAASVTNHGVMVIQGSESEFVRSLMGAVGVDVDTPDAQKKLLEIEQRAISAAPQRKTKGRTVKRKKKRTHTTASAVVEPAQIHEDDIVDAEIVDDDDTSLRDTLTDDDVNTIHTLMKPR